MNDSREPYSNATDPAFKHSKEDLKSLLDLAEEIEGRLEKATTRLNLSIGGLVVYSIGGTVFAFYQTPRAFPTEWHGLLFFFLFVILILIVASPFLFRMNKKRKTEARALNEVLEVLHEVESAITQRDAWSALERAEFRIRLSRFAVRNRMR
ncbi:MAG: hypothetical protein H6597_01530 [Flavobacteriales bacterium]|nr:hypothetical protein [Flavobacteriales bacterium]MCB9193188.1 hypothetical protein [Flavobacteriales bacterium]